MKLTKRIALLASASALATGLLAPTVQADDPPRQPAPAPTPVARPAQPAVRPTSNDRFERLHLACRKVAGTTTNNRAVHCEWRAPAGPNAAKVVLYGSVNNGPRIVLKTLRPPAAGSYTRSIPRNARQLEFVLVTFNSLGKVVGRSAVITISV
ncbi:MAG: hypothetical protein ABL953_01785 [Ilumatobacteraceae bacterium]